MKRTKKIIGRLLFIAGDAALIHAGFLLAFWIGFGGFPERNYQAYLVMRVPIVAFLTAVLFLFRRETARGTQEIARSVPRNLSFGILLAISATYFYREQAEALPTRVFLLAWAALIVLISLWRVALNALMRSRFFRRIEHRRVLIVGTDTSAVNLLHELRDHAAVDYRPVGFLSLGDGPEEIEDLPVLGTLEGMDAAIEAQKVDDVIFAVPPQEHQRVLDSVWGSLCKDVTYRVVPDLYDLYIGAEDVNQIDGIPLIELAVEPIQGWSRIAKRIVDILVSLAVLLMSLPFFWILAIAVKLSSSGPVLYGQERLGKDGRPFRLFKLRSMRVDAEADTGPVWVKEDDPRITRVGRFLRRTSLDEIPQFVSVLAGRMSLVGPRPERAHFITREGALRGRRMAVQPGLTGLAQVMGRGDLSLKEKAKYDLYYIRHYSFWLDLKILLKTIVVVLKGKGAR